MIKTRTKKEEYFICDGCLEEYDPDNVRDTWKNPLEGIKDLCENCRYDIRDVELFNDKIESIKNTIEYETKKLKKLEETQKNLNELQKLIPKETKEADVIPEGSDFYFNVAQGGRS